MMKIILTFIICCLISKNGISQQKYLFVQINHKSDYILINNSFFIPLEHKADSINLVNLFCNTESSLTLLNDFEKRIYYDEDFLYLKNLSQDLIKEIKDSIGRIQSESYSLYLYNGLTSFHFRICEVRLKNSNLLFGKKVQIPEFALENGQLNYHSKAINGFNVLIGFE